MRSRREQSWRLTRVWKGEAGTVFLRIESTAADQHQTRFTVELSSEDLEGLYRIYQETEEKRIGSGEGQEEFSSLPLSPETQETGEELPEKGMSSAEALIPPLDPSLLEDLEIPALLRRRGLDLSPSRDLFLQDAFLS